MTANFIVGQVYNRRKDIHGRFQGQRQSGIVTPAKHPFVFVFTGRGTRHGYHDQIFPDGTVHYFGEGQKGDMTLTKGNKSIATHVADNKDLLLFKMLGQGRIEFCGTFNCTGYEYKPGKDQSGTPRQALVFYLAPVGNGPGDSTRYAHAHNQRSGFTPASASGSGAGANRLVPKDQTRLSQTQPDYSSMGFGACRRRLRELRGGSTVYH